MRFSTRSKVGLLLSIVTILAIVGAFLFTVELHPSSSIHASSAGSVSTYQGHAATIKLAHAFNPGSLHATAPVVANGHIPTTRALIARRNHVSAKAQTATRSGLAAAPDTGIDPAGAK